MELESFQHILYKYTNNKFHENPSIEDPVVTCGPTRRSLQSLVAILRTRLKIHVLSNKLLRYIYWTGRGTCSNTKFI